LDPVYGGGKIAASPAAASRCPPREAGISPPPAARRARCGTAAGQGGAASMGLSDRHHAPARRPSTPGQTASGRPRPPRRNRVHRRGDPRLLLPIATAEWFVPPPWLPAARRRGPV